MLIRISSRFALYIFFYQAEDGIRDRNVTGVQTCALPILDLSRDKNVADQWILTRLNETIGQVTRHSDRYDFGEAGRYLYNFIWDDFCDWYIEMTKLPLYGDDEEAKRTTRSILIHVLDQILRMLHPFMPFVTEEFWQHLPHQGESITQAAWPRVNDDFST